LTVAAIAAALVPLAAQAEHRLSWFDDSSSYGSGGTSPVRAASLLGQGANRARFDVKLASLTAEPPAEPVIVEGLDAGIESTAVRLYGSFREPGLGAGEAQRRGGFGLSLQHRLDVRDRVSVSAEYAENISANVFAQDTAETRAVVSWTRAFGHRWQPSITGSVFVGDESARDDTYRQLGRRYLGLEVGGQMTLFKSHTPYLAFQLRRSYYDTTLGAATTNGKVSLAGTGEDSLLAPRADDRSLFTAGWRWQATRDVSLQAEATYGLNADGQDLYNPERSRVFFGTRFDFR
jgi:hypothetical protein